MQRGQTSVQTVPIDRFQVMRPVDFYSGTEPQTLSEQMETAPLSMLLGITLDADSKTSPSTLAGPLETPSVDPFQPVPTSVDSAAGSTAWTGRMQSSTNNTLQVFGVHSTNNPKTLAEPVQMFTAPVEATPVNDPLEFTLGLDSTSGTNTSTGQTGGITISNVHKLSDDSLSISTGNTMAEADTMINIARAASNRAPVFPSANDTSQFNMGQTSSQTGQANANNNAGTNLAPTGQGTNSRLASRLADVRSEHIRPNLDATSIGLEMSPNLGSWPRALGLVSLVNSNNSTGNLSPFLPANLFQTPAEIVPWSRLLLIPANSNAGTTNIGLFLTASLFHPPAEVANTGRLIPAQDMVVPITNSHSPLRTDFGFPINMPLMLDLDDD